MKILLILLFGFLVGCGAGSESETAPEQQTAALQSASPNKNQEETFNSGISTLTDENRALAVGLYQTQCQFCHASIGSTDKIGSSPEQIKRAIKEEPAMQFIQLTDEEIELIATVLQEDAFVDLTQNIVQEDAQPNTETTNNELSDQNNSQTNTSPVTTDPGNPTNGNEYAQLHADLQSLMKTEGIDCTNSCHGQVPGLSRINLLTGTVGDFAERLVNQPALSPRCEGELLIDADNVEKSLFLKLIDPNNSDALCMSKMPLGTTLGVPAESYPKFVEWVEALIDIKAQQTAESMAPEDEPEPPVIDSGTVGKAFTVLNKIKYIAHGGPITKAELDNASDGNGNVVSSQLSSIVQAWMETDAYKRKRREFLRLHLQQNPADESYFTQFGNSNGLTTLKENLRDSFVFTAERIIDNDEDFRTIVTTKDWELTTALLMTLKRIEANRNIRNQIDQQTLREAIGRRDPKPGFTAVYNEGADTQDWRTITLEHDPSIPTWSTYDDYFDAGKAKALRDIPDGGSFKVKVPRVGFFTTPAYFQKWETNVDNQFRVNVNQAMIVTLGLSFETGDDTPVNNGFAGVNEDHAQRGSECFGCHQHLDPMRNMYMMYFSPDNLRPISKSSEMPKPDFAFHDHSVSVSNIDQWAEALRTHPKFAISWTVKLCQWASSITCDASDSRLQQIAARFEASGYLFDTLMFEFLTSPLVTTTSFVDGSVQPGAMVSIARKSQFCSTIQERMSEIRRVRGLGITQNTTDLCNASFNLRQTSNAIPQGLMIRATIEPSLPVNNEPFLSTNYGNICQLMASQAVSGNSSSTLTSRNPDEALNLMTSIFLGFPPGTEQYAIARNTFDKIHAMQRNTSLCNSPEEVNESLSASSPSCGLGLNATDSLRNIFTMICQSPTLTGVGL